MWHLYVVPIIGTGTQTDHRRPKYISTFIGINWSMTDYGFQPSGLVAADVSDPQNQNIAGQPDIIAVPDDLDSLVGGNPVLSGVQNKLEANFTPGTWVTATTPYRQIARLIMADSFLLQRYSGLNNDPTTIFASFTLNSLFSSLSSAVQSGLIAAATSLLLSTALFIGSSTLRVMLKDVGDQSAAKTYTMGGITI